MMLNPQQKNTKLGLSQPKHKAYNGLVEKSLPGSAAASPSTSIVKKITMKRSNHKNHTKEM